MGQGFAIDLENMKPLVKGLGPIVVVDDDLEQHVIVRKCYEKSNKKNPLIFLQNGIEVVELMDSVLKGKSPMPELVLLDINMPGVDGFEALREMRRHPQLSRIPLVIMFTTSSAEVDINTSRDLGANAFWSKPSHIKDYIRFFEQI